MLKVALAALLAVSIIPVSTSNTTAMVERLEDNNIAVIEVAHNGNIYMGDVPMDLINGFASEGLQVPVTATTGEFTPAFNEVDSTMYYHFKSYDDTQWWFLSESQLGFIPEQGKPYTLFVSNNWTVECPHADCECAVYDDFFICVKSH